MHVYVLDGGGGGGVTRRGGGCVWGGGGGVEMKVCEIFFKAREIFYKVF